MALTYNPILPSETDPDKPLTSYLAKRWSENCEAMVDGVFGAPRLKARALSRLAAGATDMMIDTTPISRSGAGTISASRTYGIIQSGSIRARMSMTVNFGTSTTFTINRIRAGASLLVFSSTISSGPTSGSVDLFVQHGDAIQFGFSYTTGASGAGASITDTRIQCALGSDLFPTDGMFGNTLNPIL